MRNVLLGLGLMIVPLVLISLWLKQPKRSLQNRQPPPLQVDTDEGFVDMIFGITRYLHEFSGLQHIDVGAVHEKTTIGFRLTIGREWQEKAGSETGIVLHSGYVLLRSLGTASDALIHSMIQFYNTNLALPRMRRSTRCSAVVLEGHPERLDDGIVKLKVFIEPADEILYDQYYAEFYLNIDLSSRQVALREKDNDYRAPLLGALSGGTAVIVPSDR